MKFIIRVFEDYFKCSSKAGLAGFFSFSNLKVLYHCLLAPIDFDKLAIICIIILLYLMSFFPSTDFLFGLQQFDVFLPLYLILFISWV